MKKIKLNLSKLQLNKERILSLNDQEMEMIQGGTSQSVSIAMTTRTFAPQSAPQPAPESRDVHCAVVSLALSCSPNCH